MLKRNQNNERTPKERSYEVFSKIFIILAENVKILFPFYHNQNTIFLFSLPGKNSSNVRTRNQNSYQQHTLKPINKRIKIEK